MEKGLVARALFACCIALALLGGCGTGPGSDTDMVTPPDLAPQTPVVLASGQHAPRGIAVDGTRVYWTNSGDISNNQYVDNTGQIMKVPTGGGAAVELANGQDIPLNIAVDGTSVYWTNLASGQIMKVPTGGGAAVELANGQKLPVGIAVDERSVYWVNAAIAHNQQDISIVMKVPLNGGVAEGLASGLYWPNSMAMDGTNVYWTNQFLQVTKAPKSGGAEVVLETGSGNLAGGASLFGIAVNHGFVYWTNSIYGQVMIVSAVGGTAAVELARGQNKPFSIAVDGTSVYWTNLASGEQGSGQVMKMPVGGGMPVVLASGQSPAGIAVDATSVYWANWGSGQGDGQIKKVSK